MKTRLALLTLVLAAAGVSAQDKPKPIPAHQKVDQEKVDKAIQDGCRSILGAGFGTFAHGQRNQPIASQGYAELVLLTLAHSGYYKDGDPQINPLVEQVLNKQIGSTYTCSLGAMALQKLNAKKYQWRIAQFAQYLCDNQCVNGQWDYGDAIPFEEPEKIKTPTPSPKKREDVASGGAAGAPAPERALPADAPALPKAEDPAASKAGMTVTEKKGKGGKTSVTPRIPVRKRKPGPPNGDNSNSQYAALGLRACLDADIDVDPSVLLLARKWWLGAQNSDGGWGYNDHGEKGGGDNADGISNTSYGSMSVGAVGALCIYDYYLGTAFKTDGSVLKGVEWIAKNYDVTKNPGKNNFAYLYYLYGLERAGILFGTEAFGGKEWYPDGANHLLSTQSQGGGWSTSDKIAGGPRDTCFAVLFLRRGTLPLKPPEAVATGGRPEPGKAGAPVANGVPNGGNRDAGLVSNKTIDPVAAGWKLVNNGKGPDVDKLVDARGKSGVLTTYPPNLTSFPTFRKTVAVPAGKPTLHIVAGHHQSGGWTLGVKVDGKEHFTQSVAADTSQDGWVDVSVDLFAFAGKTVLIEVLDVPGGRGIELAYWAEISIKE